MQGDNEVEVIGITSVASQFAAVTYGEESYIQLGGREAEVMTHECMEMRRRRAEDGALRIMGSSLNLQQHH